MPTERSATKLSWRVSCPGYQRTVDKAQYGFGTGRPFLGDPCGNRRQIERGWESERVGVYRKRPADRGERWIDEDWYATSCLSGCVSQAVSGSAPNVGHFGIWADGIDTVYYLRDANVLRYTVSTGAHVVFADSLTPFAFVGGKSKSAY